MSRSRGIATASSVLTLAGAVLLLLAPAAQARPDPGQPPPPGSGVSVVREFAVREVTVPSPIDDGAFEPLQVGLAALVGAAAVAGASAGRQRLHRPRAAGLV